jgi:hypothetical protein
MLRVRVTAEEERTMRKRAGAMGLSLSSYLRWCALASWPRPAPLRQRTAAGTAAKKKTVRS